MKFQNCVIAAALAALLAACQTTPDSAPPPEEDVATEVEQPKTILQQWEEAKPALLTTLRADARLRVIEQEDGSLYVQIRSGSSFTIGGSKPSAELAATLDHVAEAVKGYDFLTLTISGHSDNVGNAQHNIQLSEQRAKDVFDYLQAQGVQQPMLYEGLGSEKPIASNDTSEGRAVNRRVDVVILPASENRELSL